APDLPLQPLDILLRRAQTRDAEHDAVAEEDLAERAADDRADAPAHQRLRRMLARGAAAEVLAHHQHRRALVGRRVEWVLGVLLARIFERVLTHRLERDGLEEA